MYQYVFLRKYRVLFISAKQDGNSGHYGTWGARRKGDARMLTVWYANGGGTDSADGGNTSSIWQNYGIIPQGICTTILCFSEEQFGLVLLIVDPLREPLSEEHLIRLVADG